MRDAQVWDVAAEPQQGEEQLQPDLAAAAAAEQLGSPCPGPPCTGPLQRSPASPAR